MGKIYTVAIIGVGARGANAYGWQLHEQKDRFKIVALCDLLPERLEMFGDKFEVPEKSRYLDENEFFKEKRADLLLVATQDKDHVGHCLKGFELGYDIMTEKPLTDKREECEILLEAQRKAGTKALVCHVLRYAPAFLKAAEIIDSGAIGKLVAIDALERVGFWHQAHSYVRGNWRNTEIAAPMILAKCCHDLDLLQYYAKSKCACISSMGDLVHFKPENKPEGAAERCVDCKYYESCPYSGKNIYIDDWKRLNCPEDVWPYNVLTTPPITEEKMYEALRTGPYGRCVYCCDNNVVDHQLTTMTFENGVKATLTMTAFTSGSGRRLYFHGTMGELVLEEEEHRLVLKRYQQFNRPAEVIDINVLSDSGYGHGGGDIFIIRKLYEMLEGNVTAATSFEASIESHLMGICAEESRLAGGQLVYVHKNSTNKGELV